VRCEGSARAFALVAAIRAMAQALIEPTVISWEGRGQSHFQLAFSYEVGLSVCPQCPLRPPTLPAACTVGPVGSAALSPEPLLA
jgi:hypothetical protein